ncbi:MAG: hypothetical protein D6695_01535 [Planctomycetota bacterium]|nr:MAG: hypothetical protein D6695_01535 [Planctomycetota bacterium]
MTGQTPGKTGSEWLEGFEQTLDTLTSTYGQLDALSRRQESLIETGEMEQLLSLLSERQGLIQQLEATVPAFDAGRKAWEQNVNSLTESKRCDVQRRVKAIEQMASEIAARDEAASKDLDRLRDELADQMAGLGRGSAAVSAYGQKDKQPPSPRFQDRRG